MSRMISHCGYSCHLCPADSDNSNAKNRMIEGLSKYHGGIEKKDSKMVRSGCLSNGEQLAKGFGIRSYVLKKHLEHCIDCKEFPCKETKKKWLSREGILLFMFPHLRNITKEEYDAWAV